MVMSRVPSLVCDLLSRPGLIDKGSIPRDLTVLATNLDKLRKVANCYPHSTFRFINYVMENQRWDLLRLLEKKVVGTKGDIPFDLMESRVEDAESEDELFVEIHPVDLIYALVKIVDIEEYYGDYEVDIRLFDYDITATIQMVDKCYQDKRPFALLEIDGDIQPLTAIYPDICTWGVDARDVPLLRSYIRLRSMLMSYDMEVLSLHKLPDGSSYLPPCDGMTLVREIIIRWGDEMGCEVKRSYIEVNMRKAGIEDKYYNVLKSVTTLRDITPEYLSRKLDQIGREIDEGKEITLPGGGGGIEYATMYAVALLRPQRVDVLYGMGMRIVTKDGSVEGCHTIRCKDGYDILRHESGAIPSHVVAVISRLLELQGKGE